MWRNWMWRKFDVPSRSSTPIMRVDQRHQIGDSGLTRVSADSCAEGASSA